VGAKQTERVTRGIGRERVAERDAAVAAFAALPLAEKFRVPPGVTPPDLAAVMVDGGRLQILDRRPSPPDPPPSDPPPEGQPPAAPAAPATAETWVEEASTVPRSGHWREDKVALLVTMQSAVSDKDPCPEIPESFVDPTRIPRLVRELRKNVKDADDAVAEAAEPEAADQALARATKYQAPQVVQRQVVASRGGWPSFAPVVAQAAWAAGFQGAARRAFVGDGAANNWALQRSWFGSFVPILDFIHALSYVFAAAMAGRTFAVGWSCYAEWIGWVWQGQVVRVIAALEARQAELGEAEAGEPETSPRAVVARTLRYLRNHQGKMHYEAYRREGLPLTSSLMESVVKQMNQRVKGTEKFWSEAGSEAVLQLRADHLSDGEPLRGFWERRQAAASGQRRYRKTG